MPFILAPAIRIVNRDNGESNNIVSAVYDFSTDTPLPGGIRFIPGRPNIDGTYFTIDLTNIARPRSLPAIRSMQFTVEFNASLQEPFMDGPVIFYVPATGEVLEFGPAYRAINAPAPSDSVANAVTTAVVPLVCAAPTKIQVVKGIGGGTSPLGSGLYGNIILNLYDFDRQPYIAQSFYNGFLGG
jgi:hypothetical protein